MYTSVVRELSQRMFKLRMQGTITRAYSMGPPLAAGRYVTLLLIQMPFYR